MTARANDMAAAEEKMESKPSWRWLLAIGCYLVPSLVLFSLWIPVVNHYHVSGVEVTDAMLDAARQQPSDLILEELKDVRFFSRPWDSEQQLIEVATKLLTGEAAIPGYPETTLAMPFDDRDLDRGPRRWQFFLAQFRIPEILLEAYKASGRVEFFRMARDVIVEWAAYERRAWLPKGFLWNDHAIAERMLVLAEFWRLYRRHPEYDPKAAKIVLELAARSSQLLAKPNHYTFSSNHGVMQNLALWRFCLAFPTLPNVEAYKQLALNRMRDQMGFFINDEGVVLEHSAGYHKVGLQFFGMALRYLTLMNVPIPPEWAAKYERAKGVYAQLRRPDGSLPAIGDTSDTRDPLGPLVTDVDAYGRASALEYQRAWRPLLTESLYPIAGYSIWWSGLDTWPDPQKLTQTVVAWSYFPGHAHKHADEMSVLLWAGGQTWWTNVGYWPYDLEGRAAAESWEGSNAPHLASEGPRSARTTRLRTYGWADDIAVLDLQRSGPGAFIARRQVIQLRPNLWIILDHVSGNDAEKSLTRWRTSGQISIDRGDMPNAYNLRPEDSDASLTAFLFGSDGAEVTQVNDIFASFPGRQPVGSGIDVGAQLVVAQPANDSWSVAVWSWENSHTSSPSLVQSPRMVHWHDAEDWKLTLPIAGGTKDVWREGHYVFLRNHIGSIGFLPLHSTDESEMLSQANQIRDAYVNAEDKYQGFNVLFGYRVKATQLLIFILIGQGIFFTIYKIIKGKHQVSLQIVVLTVWLGILIIGIPFFDVIIDLYSKR